MAELPFTQENRRPFRYPWSRIYGSGYRSRKCKFCGADNLDWYRNISVRGAKYRLGDPEGYEHTCPKYNASFGTAPDTRAVSSTTSRGTGEADSDVTLTTRVRAIMEPHLREYSTTLAATITQKANQAIDQGRDRMLQVVTILTEKVAKQVVQELVPVEHSITVRRDVGTSSTIQSRPHMKLQVLVDVLSQRLHVMMVGPAGSGKTTAAHQAAQVLDLPYYESSMGPATSQWDLVGFRSPDGKYIPGILREPYENGGVLMLDEMDNTNPSVLTALNSAISNGRATFPDGAIKKHPDFVLIAAGNTYGRGADRLYVGRNQLDAATLDRFVVLDWDYDEAAELDWAGRDQIDWIKYVQAIRHEAIKHAMRVIISPRASIFGARLLRAGMDRDLVATMTLWKGMATDDKERLIRNVG